MKKQFLPMFVFMFLFVLSSTALADGMEQFYDYKNDDGTYSYYFEQGITVTMSEDWYQNTMVLTDDDHATFYHKDSYKKYKEEGYEGGRLFTIACSDNTDYTSLPSFEDLGYDEANMLHYFIVFPTDLQAYHDDADMAAYQRLYTSKDEVIASIEIDGVTDTGDVAPFSASGQLSGGWSMAEDITVTDEVRALVEEAAGQLLGATYEPVALLGTQVVAGTNYCVLCRKSAVVQNPQYEYVLMYIWKDLDGKASLLGFDDIELGDYD